MKRLYYKYIFLGLLLLIGIMIIKKTYNSIESIENISVNIGNYLSVYFSKFAISIINKKDFVYEDSNEEFIKNLPKKIKYKYEETRAQLLKNNIDNDYFENVETDSAGTWHMKDKKTEKLWNIMKPLIQNIMDDVFLKSNLVKHIDYPVIHFRCADTPFIKHKHYHFQKYKFYKDSLDYISSKTNKTYDTVIIVYSNTHNSSKNDREKCDIYANSMSEYLKTIGYKSIIQNESNLDDFATLYYAPAVISPGSSYSFMSGFFGKGLFVSGGHQSEGELEISGIGDWLFKGYNVMHSEIKDYQDTDGVIKILSN
jgi:hypothetical protein